MSEAAFRKLLADERDYACSLLSARTVGAWAKDGGVEEVSRRLGAWMTSGENLSDDNALVDMAFACGIIVIED